MTKKEKNMQVEKVLSEGLKREYNITIGADNITSKVDSRLKEIAVSIKMPGFRPGKVPPHIVRKNHGKEVMGEVLEKVIEESSRDALTKEDIRPAMRPKVEIIDFKEGNDLKYKMEFEVLPKVPKVDFSKISVERPKVELSDKDIDSALEKLAANLKDFKAVDRKAKKGDAVIMDFKGFVDDEAFEGGEGKGHTLELGSKSFIDGFEDQLIGTKAGDAKDVNVTFPKEYHKEDLAGKAAKFEVKIHEVQEANKHELNDNLAKKLGLEDIKALRKAITEQMNKEMEQASRSRAKKALFDVLDKDYKFPVPEQMLNMEFESVWKQIEDAKKANPDSDEFNKPEKELQDEYMEMSERRVRLGIMLSSIGNDSGITISDSEISNAAMQEAQQYPGQEKQVLDYFRQNPEQLEALKGPILEEKVVDFILDKIKIKEKNMTLEDMQEPENDE